jgi:hypothetical protein
MTKTFFADNATLMSPRTAKYVEAMIREGDNFDYDEWLKRVREEDAQAKPIQATGSSGELAAADIEKPLSTPDHHYSRSNAALRLETKTMRVPRAPHRQAEDQTGTARLRRRLEKVRRAWGEFQASRKRDAVYGYLEAVFGIVEHYKVRRRTNRLLRHAFKFANLLYDKSAGAFAAVIRCTSGGEADRKTISKWARALRFAAGAKKSQTSLKQFMKRMGGINACAAQYARTPHNR